MNGPRESLRRVYAAGVRRVRGFDAVCDYLDAHPAAHPSSHPLHLVAIGKAASAMTLGALAACGGRIADGLVITKHGHLDHALARHRRIACVESDHPVPGDNTLRAGERLLAYLDEHADGDAHFLFLLSGGASSLVEVPPPGVGLDDLRSLTGQLLASGFDINRMNRVRRALSGIKGGRLAAHLKRCPTLSLLISDVPGDDPGVIGSGLLTPVRESVDADEYPGAVRELLARAELVPVPDAAEFNAIEAHIVACLDDAKDACVSAASSMDCKVIAASKFIEGDVAEVATRLCGQLRNSNGEVLIWGGEPTVKLPAEPGRGGRNQQLALAVALQIKGEPGLYFLSAGTDGTDGPTDDAGALVDGASVKLGEAQGFDAKDCLRRADAGAFLEASGDLITTGPTGTNVMDLMIGFKDVNAYA